MSDMSGFAPPPGMVLPPPEWELPLPTAWEHDGVRTLRAVPFVSEPGYRAVYLDLHLPLDARGPVPLVVFIHGGAFLFGTREILTPVYYITGVDAFAEVARAGLAVASVDYRLSSEATYPAPLHDVAAAVRFLVHRAPELGIDTARMAVWGESAGAHLALLLAFCQDDPTMIGSAGAPAQIPPFAALVSWYGLADLREELVGLPFPGPSAEARLLGGPVSTNLDLAALASPITHTHRGAPPTLLLHGTADRLIPLSQSEAVAAALTAEGVPVETLWIEGEDHAWTGTADGPATALAATRDFLVRRLSP